MTVVRRGPSWRRARSFWAVFCTHCPYRQAIVTFVHRDDVGGLGGMTKVSVGTPQQAYLPGYG